VDILISEVATVRRFLDLGSAAQTIDEQLARDTAAQITAYYPRVLLRGVDHFKTFSYANGDLAFTKGQCMQASLRSRPDSHLTGQPSGA
jgi:hypothetical protein